LFGGLGKAQDFFVELHAVLGALNYAENCGVAGVRVELFLRIEFLFRENEMVMAEQTGADYWLWKPFIVLKAFD